MRDQKSSNREAELPAITRIGSGDLLDTVFCGDNTEILSGFPAECVDLVVTSPPYDELRTYGNHSWNFEALAAQLVRVLKPGGRVALLAWGAMEQPYFQMTVGAVRRVRPELEIPAGAQTMFKFGEAGTLGAALREAGFGAVEEKLEKLRWDWHGSPEEMWDYFRGVTVPFRGMLEKVDGDAAVDAAVLAALNEQFDGEYVRMDAQMVVATARKE